MVLLQVSHENFEEKGKKGRRREEEEEEGEPPYHSILDSPLYGALYNVQRSYKSKSKVS
jgi:hypothetical protein